MPQVCADDNSRRFCSELTSVSCDGDPEVGRVFYHWYRHYSSERLHPYIGMPHVCADGQQ